MNREKLDESRKVGADPEFFAGDRDGEVDTDRRPELDPHDIGRGAVELTDAQALLHRAEQKFDQRALAVELREGGISQRLAVGPEGKTQRLPQTVDDH